jgi:hypothetical protein
MSGRIERTVLRGVAFAIVISALIDPALSISGASQPRIALVELTPSSATGRTVRDRLTRDLATSYEIVPVVTSDAAAAIVIGDGYPAEREGDSSVLHAPDALLVATVTVDAIPGPGVRIVRLTAPSQVPAGTVIHLDAELEGRGVSGQSTDVAAKIAGLESSHVSHRWTTDSERWHAALDIVPIGEAPFVIRVEAKSVDESRRVANAPAENGSTAEVIVDVRRAPIRVEFYDPRPSWAATFVRRALEADPRFDVSTFGFSSRGVSSKTGNAVALDDSRLDGFEVIVVGGLDRLSQADVRSLERYLRERGGALVVLPDQRIEVGPALDLADGQEFVERLLEQPVVLAGPPPVASLRASELLVLRSIAPLTDVVARVPGADPSSGPGAATIVSMPRGDGRLLLSGAMDAWRYRASDNGAFDRFWQSTIAGLGLAVAPPISIGLEPQLPRPGQPVDVTVRVRSRNVSSVSASVDRSQPVRLLPDPEPGQYRGRFVARDTPGRSTLAIDLQGAQPLTASRTVVIPHDVQRVRSAAAPALRLLASSHRGIDVTPEHLADLESFIRRSVASPRVPIVRHPMRSAWWMLPLAACLSAEWWMRRRRGLR